MAEKLIGTQVRLPESLHKELKKKLIDDGLSVQEFLLRKVLEYLKK